MLRRAFMMAALAVQICSCTRTEAGRAAGPVASGPSIITGEPDYGTWNRLLAKYYNPAHGMDYAQLKANDAKVLEQVRHDLGGVSVRSLTPKQQLAYWINLYNVNVVATVVDHYPVSSIRDISTDPIIRLNVFKKETVPFGTGMISLNTIENEKLREGFHDPRIHFAINCAARNCPPIRSEAYVGARVDEQLDDQVRRFVVASGVRVEQQGGKTIVHATKIMDWFGDDFDKWGGGKIAFLRRYLQPAKAKLIPPEGGVTIEYDDYDWQLNDWRR